MSTYRIRHEKPSSRSLILKIMRVTSFYNVWGVNTSGEDRRYCSVAIADSRDLFQKWSVMHEKCWLVYCIFSKVVDGDSDLFTIVKFVESAQEAFKCVSAASGISLSVFRAIETDNKQMLAVRGTYSIGADQIRSQEIDNKSFEDEAVQEEKRKEESRIKKIEEGMALRKKRKNESTSIRVRHIDRRGKKDDGKGNYISGREKRRLKRLRTKRREERGDIPTSSTLSDSDEVIVEHVICEASLTVSNDTPIPREVISIPDDVPHTEAKATWDKAPEEVIMAILSILNPPDEKALDPEKDKEPPIVMKDIDSSPEVSPSTNDVDSFLNLSTSSTDDEDSSTSPPELTQSDSTSFPDQITPSPHLSDQEVVSAFFSRMENYNSILSTITTTSTPISDQEKSARGMCGNCSNPHTGIKCRVTTTCTVMFCSRECADDTFSCICDFK